MKRVSFVSHLHDDSTSFLEDSPVTPNECIMAEGLMLTASAITAEIMSTKSANDHLSSNQLVSFADRLQFSGLISVADESAADESATGNRVDVLNSF